LALFTRKLAPVEARAGQGRLAPVEALAELGKLVREAKLVAACREV
jgi:hypothetical protein